MEYTELARQFSSTAQRSRNRLWRSTLLDIVRRRRSMSGTKSGSAARARSRRQEHNQYFYRIRRGICWCVDLHFQGCQTGATLSCTCGLSPCTRPVHHVRECIPHTAWECTDVKATSTTSGQCRTQDQLVDTYILRGASSKKYIRGDSGEKIIHQSTELVLAACTL